MPKKKSTQAPPRRSKRSATPIRWDELAHDEIRIRADQLMSFGSVDRAATDAKVFVLRRRLPLMQAEEHLEYVALECARIVETLRCVRDAYREFLEEKGCGPTAEMFWVVVRFGVKDWAVMVLRSAAFRYIASCNLSDGQWHELFDHRLRTKLYPRMTPPELGLSREELLQDLPRLLPANVFDRNSTGGPFSRPKQPARVPENDIVSLFSQPEGTPGEVAKRQEHWDTQVWAEGLSRLFDSAQEESNHQIRLLGQDAHRAERGLKELPKLDRIAYEHLRGVTVAKNSVVSGEGQWEALLLELHREGVRPEHVLTGTGRKILATARRKGWTAATLQDCYACTRAVVSDDGKTRTLRRELTRCLHNAAERAARQREKVWTRPTKIADGKMKRKLLQGHRE